MARGDVQLSPFTWRAQDYVGLAIGMSIDFDNMTKALLQVTVTRDPGCQYNTMVLGVPSDGASKRLQGPVDTAGPRTFNAAALLGIGLTTLDDVLATQITAEP